MRCLGSLRLGVSIYTLLTVGTVIAAICSAVIGRDTEQRQLRAYILPTQATIGITNANEVKATAIIKNFGQTPAYHFRFWACLAVRDFVVKDNTPVDSTDLQEWWKDISKLPQSTVPQQDIAHIRAVFSCDNKQYIPRVLTVSEKNGIDDSSKAIYLYGNIFYDDIFGYPHETHFRRFTNAQFGLRDGTTSSATEGNDAN